ncbi:MAG TPA: hypothetical protein VMZ53_34515, partial [Kofleriaceae bacterium]|nr:hypothetical protein [Kofleriaceae bacterium]
MRVGRCLWVAVALAALCVGCDDQDGVRHLDAWVDTPIADADVDATPVDAANVTVAASASTGGTVTVTVVTDGTCSGTSCTLATGASTVTFTPTASTGYRFDTWTGSSCTGYTASGDAITFTNPIVDHACTASFVATVDVVAVAGAGGSIVATSVTGGVCTGTACTLDAGASTVTFTPTAAANHAFSGWSGCTGYTQSGDSITFTNPTSAKACTASFGATVAISATAGTGGTVAASSVTGGGCSGTSCTLDSGASTVTFTPTPNANYRFNSWSGCTGYTQSGNAITFTNPTTPQSCTASFVATVSVSATAGTGGSVAAGTPTGGTCVGTTCALDSGASSVTFTPTANANYRFGGWTGCTGYTQSGNAITFTNPTAAKACTANFVATVIVSASAGTGGTVAASTPTGGTCAGTTCTLDSGASSVTFTPTANANFRFGGWSGASCTGYTTAGDSITFTNPATAKACTASFVATVNVSASAGTGGTVAAGAPAGGTCTG